MPRITERGNKHDIRPSVCLSVADISSLTSLRPIVFLTLQYILAAAQRRMQRSSNDV